MHRIGIDCRMWNETGIGRYISSFVSELAKKDTSNEYVLFLLSDTYDSLQLPPNFTKIKVNIKWHTFSEQFILPFIFLRAKLDLLHVPHFNVPILYPKKFLVTIHDLSILRVRTGRATTLPYPIYFIKWLAFNLALFSAAKRSKYIFTVSNFVKNDLIKTYKIPASKIILTPCAISDKFKSQPSQLCLEVLKKYQITQPYLFYVGNAQPHKNIEKLMQAFELVSINHPAMQLVLGGNKKFFYERLEREISNCELAKKINFVGFVEDADLPHLYSGSAAFIDPSLYEGFGIQILEAFGCGTKVIASNTTSLPEIGGQGAYYFDPHDYENMADVILLALGDADFNIKRERGFERVKQFSWQESAQTILKTYETCISL